MILIIYSSRLIDKCFYGIKPLIDVSDKDSPQFKRAKLQMACRLFQSACNIRNIYAHGGKLDWVNSQKKALEILALFSILFHLTDKGRLKQK